MSIDLQLHLCRRIIKREEKTQNLLRKDGIDIDPAFIRVKNFKRKLNWRKTTITTTTTTTIIITWV